MLTSILTPVVHGNRRAASGRRWLKLAVLHSLGTIGSAAFVGGILSAIFRIISRSGLRPSSWAYWTAVFVIILYLPRLMGWTKFPPLLQSTRQVPRTWAYDYPRWAAALLFGLGLGSGLYTRIIVPTFYLLLIWPFLMPGFLLSVLIWSTYGFARSGNLWWLALTASVQDPFARASKLTYGLMRNASWMYRANTILLLAVGAWLIAWRHFG